MSALGFIALGALVYLAAREILKWDLAGPDGEPLPPDPTPILVEEPGRHRIAQQSRRQHRVASPSSPPVLSPSDLQGLVDVGAAQILVTPREVELPLDGESDWDLDDIMGALSWIESLG